MEDDAGRSTHEYGSEESSGVRGLSQFPSPLHFDLHTTSRLRRSSESGKGGLHMADLQLLSHFLIHTSKHMSLNPAKRLAWDTVIPGLATKHEFLMHLLLALAGLDYYYPDKSTNGSFPIDLAPQATHTRSNERTFPGEVLSECQTSLEESKEEDVFHLQTIIEHHQSGLRGFRDQLAALSTSNCNQVFAGSMLLVAFAFASLRARNMNDLRSSTDSQSINLRLDWIYLIQGLTTVIKEHWTLLKMGPLRDMLLFTHSNDDWQLYPREMFAVVSLEQSERCSRRISKFCHGAYAAYTALSFFVDHQSHPLNDQDMSGDDAAHMPEQSSLDSTQVISRQKDTIRILEQMYMRILYVVQFSRVSTQSSHTVQSDMEDAAVMAWPESVPRKFFHTLEGFGDLSSLSYTILAYLYLTFSLFEDTWFLKGSFDEEILKINRLINNTGNSRLIRLMQWPVSVLDE